jgi:transcription-repair coupling factor (superfamily II helicase)
MTLKEDTMRCFFINRPDSPYFESEIFKNLIGFTNTSMNNAHFKQVGKTFILIIKDIQGMKACLQVLTKMHNGVIGKA